MKKRLVAALFTVFSAIQIINVDSFAIENTGFSIKKEMLPLEEGVSLHDISGKIYFHMENEGSINVSLDKIEPEGVFRFYNANIKNEKSTSDIIYGMLLSQCEYLVDSGEYASYYTLNIVSSMDNGSSYSQKVIIKDPDFENISDCEYHFYITMKPSYNSGYKILSSNEFVSEDNVFISEHHIELDYLNLGDLDQNGKLDIKDAIETLNLYSMSAALLPTDEFTEAQKKAADINRDGKVDIADAMEILRIYSENAVGA